MQGRTFFELAISILPAGVFFFANKNILYRLYHQLQSLR